MSEATQTPEDGKPLQMALTDRLAKAKRELAGSYRRYVCPPCATTHKRDYDTQDCCQPEVDEVYECPSCEQTHDTLDGALACEAAHSGFMNDPLADSVCPVCMKHANDIRGAVDCCLWIRLNWAERDQLARDVQFGRHDPAASRTH